MKQKGGAPFFSEPDFKALIKPSEAALHTQAGDFSFPQPTGDYESIRMGAPNEESE